MYSMVLLAAMTAGTAEAPAFHGGYGLVGGGSNNNFCVLDSCHPIRYGAVAPRSPGCGDSWWQHSRPLGGYCGHSGYGSIYTGHGYGYGCGSCGGCHSYGCWGGCGGWQYPLYSGSCTGANCYGSCFGHAWGQTDTYHPGVGAGYAGFGAYGNYGAYGLIPAPVEPNIYSAPSGFSYPQLQIPSGTTPMNNLPPIINPMLSPAPVVPMNPLVPPLTSGSGLSGIDGGIRSTVPEPYSPLIEPKLTPEPKSVIPPEISGKKVSLSRVGTIVVEVPETARVFIDGNIMSATGSVRSFRTPALRDDDDFFYTIRVVAEQDGRTVEESKKVYIRAGERSAVNFFGVKVERPRVALDR